MVCSEHHEILNKIDGKLDRILDKIDSRVSWRTFSIILSLMSGLIGVLYYENEKTSDKVNTLQERIAKVEKGNIHEPL